MGGTERGKECTGAGECLCGSLKAAIPRFPALNKMNTNLMIGDKYKGTNGPLSALVPGSQTLANIRITWRPG